MPIEKLYEWSVCQDCLMYIANDDLTGLSNYLNDDEIEEKKADMDRALHAVYEDDGGHAVASGDDLGFSRSSCDCCGTHLAGDRYQINILGKVDDPRERERYVSDCIASVMPDQWATKVNELAEAMGVVGILGIPGVRDLVREELHNDVFKQFETKFNEQYDEEQS